MLFALSKLKKSSRQMRRNERNAKTDVDAVEIRIQLIANGAPNAIKTAPKRAAADSSRLETESPIVGQKFARKIRVRRARPLPDVTGRFLDAERAGAVGKTPDGIRRSQS